MRTIAALALLAAGAAAAAPAAAQVSPSVTAQRYDPAPWWMAQPVVASIGYVRFELRANRASFDAGFQAIDRDAAGASRAAAEKVREVAEALRGYGAERVRVQTTVSIHPLYDQYRNRQGQVQENQRADQVERYVAVANVSVEVRDTAVLERVYGTVLAARPTSIGQPYFRLEPGEAVRAALYGEAVEDAARRARRAAEAAGARLGAPRVIDPTGRACQTDILARPEDRGRPDDLVATDVEAITVTGSRVNRGAPPPPPPPPAMAPAPEAPGGAPAAPPLQLPLQPPVMELTSRACIVYALG